MLVVTSRLKIPDDEFTFTFARSSGPGGQNVNKVNTKATLRWRVTESPSLPEAVRQRFLAAFPRRVTNDGDVIVTSQRYRDQARNLDDCREKLSAMLAAVATPPKPRKKTRPTKAAKARRLEEKRRQSTKKQRRRPPGPDV